MDRIQASIGALTIKEALLTGYAARQSHMCKRCAKPARSFRTPHSKQELSISSICQACQGYYFYQQIAHSQAWLSSRPETAEW